MSNIFYQLKRVSRDILLGLQLDAKQPYDRRRLVLSVAWRTRNRTACSEESRRSLERSAVGNSRFSPQITSACAYHVTTSPMSDMTTWARQSGATVRHEALDFSPPQCSPSASAALLSGPLASLASNRSRCSRLERCSDIVFRLKHSQKSIWRFGGLITLLILLSVAGGYYGMVFSSLDDCHGLVIDRRLRV